MLEKEIRMGLFTIAVFILIAGCDPSGSKQGPDAMESVTLAMSIRRVFHL